MTTRNTILSIVLLCLFGNCKKEQIGLTYQFEHFELAKFQPLPYENKWVMSPTKVCLVDDLILLFVAEEHVDHYFHLYKNDGSFIASFGDKEGPNGFHQAHCYCQFIKEEDQLNLVTYDSGTRYIRLIDLNAVKVGSTDIFTNSFTGPELYLQKGIYLNKANQSVFGLGGGANGVVFNYKLQTKELYWNTEKPLTNKNYSRAVTDLIYTANSSVDSENNIFSVAYVLFNRIDQFDLEGNFLHSVYYKDIEKTEPIIVNNFPAPANKIRYSHIQSGYGYHYIIYQGHSRTNEEETHNWQLHIIDYKGRAIKAIELPYSFEDFALIDQNNLIFLFQKEDDTYNQLYTLKIDF